MDVAHKNSLMCSLSTSGAWLGRGFLYRKALVVTVFMSWRMLSARLRFLGLIPGDEYLEGNIHHLALYEDFVVHPLD